MRRVCFIYLRDGNAADVSLLFGVGGYLTVPPFSRGTALFCSVEQRVLPVIDLASRQPDSLGWQLREMNHLVLPHIKVAVLEAALIATQVWLVRRQWQFIRLHGAEFCVLGSVWVPGFQHMVWGRPTCWHRRCRPTLSFDIVVRFCPVRHGNRSVLQASPGLAWSFWPHDFLKLFDV